MGPSIKVQLIFDYRTIETIRADNNFNGKTTPEGFKGPTFEGVSYVTYDDNFVSVNLNDGTVYRYPTYSVQRIKEYQ